MFSGVWEAEVSYRDDMGYATCIVLLVALVPTIGSLAPPMISDAWYPV